jgi:hypothetical protein
MEPSAARLRAAILEAVDTQIREGTPPATRETFERLQREGTPPAEAKRLIAAVLSAEIFNIAKHHQTYDETRYVRRLQQLPVMPWTEDEEA